jgi:hypothetical protein
MGFKFWRLYVECLGHALCLPYHSILLAFQTEVPRRGPCPQVGAAAAAAAAEGPSAPVLSQQQLADLVWAVGHYDWGHCVAALAPRMDVPFAVVPQFMPALRLQVGCCGACVCVCVWLAGCACSWRQRRRQCGRREGRGGARLPWSRLGLEEGSDLVWGQAVLGQGAGRTKSRLPPALAMHLAHFIHV